MADVFGVEPARVAHGGTLPIARNLAEFLPPYLAVLGIALPGANMRGPNDWVPWYQLERSMKTMTRLCGEVSR